MSSAWGGFGALALYAGWENFIFGLDEEGLDEDTDASAHDTGFRAGVQASLPIGAPGLSVFVNGGVLYNKLTTRLGDDSGSIEFESDNALGTPPNDVIEECHAAGLKVAALAGAPKHAQSHVANGVDIIVAQGYEAGGHTGEIASMVLTPDIVDAVGPDVAIRLDANQGWTPRDVQELYVSAGPGSFTGLRTAAAVAQGVGGELLEDQEQAVAGARASGQDQVARMLSGVDFTPGVGVDFGS